MRILIVDDEQGMLNALRFGLTSFGYQIRTVTNGREALNIIESAIHAGERIELLLTDLQMPGMNGIELIHSARKLDPTLPAILMTAFGENGIKKKTIKLGRCDYIEKPFNPEAILGKIKKIEIDSDLGEGSSLKTQV